MVPDSGVGFVFPEVEFEFEEVFAVEVSDGVYSVFVTPVEELVEVVAVLVEGGFGFLAGSVFDEQFGQPVRIGGRHVLSDLRTRRRTAQSGAEGRGGEQSAPTHILTSFGAGTDPRAVLRLRIG